MSYFDLSGEDLIVWGVLTDPEKNVPKIASLIGAEMFTEDRNKKLFSEILRLHRAGRAVNVMALPPELTRNAGQMITALPITDRVPLEDYAATLKDQYLRRQMAGVFLEADLQLRDGVSREEVWKLIDSIREETGSQLRPIVSIGQLAEQFGTLQAYEEMSVSCLKSSFNVFDRAVIMKEGDLIILCGRPGMGKTDVGLLYGKDVAKNGSPVGVFSMEMRGQYLMKRAAISEGSQLTQQISGTKQEVEAYQFVKGAEQLANLPIFIDDSSIHDVNSLRIRIKQMIDKHGIKLAVVDYLTLMEAGADGNRAELVERLARGLKLIANDFGIPLIVVAQLNRKVEERPDKRPVMSDLRESGGVEQNADTVLGAFRPWYYESKGIKWGEVKGVKDISNYLEIGVLKQREGDTLPVQFHYNPATKFLGSWSNQEEIQGWRNQV